MCPHQEKERAVRDGAKQNIKTDREPGEGGGGGRVNGSISRPRLRDVGSPRSFMFAGVAFLFEGGDGGKPKGGVGVGGKRPAWGAFKKDGDSPGGGGGGGGDESIRLSPFATAVVGGVCREGGGGGDVVFPLAFDQR